MIVKLSDFLKKQETSKKFYLLYGANDGQIEEVIDNILKPKISKNVFNYDENDILKKTDEFEESILSESFFDDEKLIIINRCSDKILEIIKNSIEKKVTKVTFIIKANILEKRSKLRVFFEKNPDVNCIAFYEDNYQSLMTIAQNFFIKNKIKISPQIINHLVEKSKKNRVNLKNELEKIKIFCQNKSSIEFSDILKLTTTAENYDISELTDQCLAKNKKKAVNIMNENISTTEGNILILKSFLFKLKRLRKLKKEIEKKKTQDQVISSYKPPIFWKDKDIIKKQLSILSSSDIKEFIKRVNELELLIKKNSNIAHEITNNFILETIKHPNNAI